MSSPAFKLENIIYRAGAGAGKTTTLVNKVIEIAQGFKAEHGRYPRMIVTTFTRKATQELRERLLREGYERGSPELIQFFLSQRELHISTIHGVLHLLLHRYGSRIGLDPGFSFLEPSEAVRRSKILLRSLVYENENYEELLNLLGFNGIVQRVRAIEKTLRLLPQVKPHDLSSLKETVEQYALALGDETREIANNIRSETSKEDWLEFANLFESISKNLKSYFANQGVIVSAFEGRRKPANSKAKPAVSDELDEKVKELQKKIKAFDDEIFKLDNLKIFSDRYKELHELATEYSKKVVEDKMRTGRIEIDDLELLSIRLLKENSDVAEAFSKEWDYWLIDEFQDTSPLQVELLDFMKGASPHLVVGDPQQSIYFFRGARSEVFTQKENEIREAQGHLERLDRNYRSTPELLLFLNDLVQDFGVGFEPMRPKTEDVFDPTKLVSVFGRAHDELEEMNFITNHIHQLMSSGVSLEKICILARKNSTLNRIAQHLNHFGVATQVHAASGFFDRREILDLLSMLKFLVNPHDNYNLIELLRTPWFRLSDDKIVSLALKRSQEKSTQSLWTYISKAEQSSHSVLQLIKSIELSKSSGVIAAFEEMLINSGVVDVSHYHDTTGQRESNIWKFLHRLREESRRSGFHILSFIKNSQKSMDLDEFGGDSDASPAFEPNRVNLMTIHMSKGLQFEYVFVPQMDAKPESSRRSVFTLEAECERWCCELPIGSDLKGSSPLNSKLHNTLQSQQEILESERLFYVSVTRAKERVYLSFGSESNETSWLSKMRWPLELGAFKNDFYTYKVEEGPWDVEPMQKRMVRSQKTLAPLQAPEAQTKLEQNISVSRVLDLWEELTPAPKPTSTVIENVPSRVERAINGTLVHKLFESFHYHGFEKGLEFIESHISGDKKLVQQSIDFVLKAQEVPLKLLIEKGEVEWGFLARFGRTVLEGQIDLWGYDGNTIWIVDYKTGSPRHASRAQQQLELYALAVKKSGAIGNFKLAAVFPMHNTILTFDSPDFDKLEKRLLEL